MNFDKGLIGGRSALLVLSLLAENDYYGYEMIRTLEERSDETFLYYQITKAGLAQLEHEIEQWETFSSSVNKVILGSKIALGHV